MDDVGVGAEQNRGGIMGSNRSGFLAGRVGRVLLIGGLAVGAATSARAMEVTQEQREACTPDAFRLCSAEIPDVNRVTACMIAKKASLSPACRAVFAAMDAGQSAQPHRHKVHVASAHRHHHRWHRYSRYWHSHQAYYND